MFISPSPREFPLELRNGALSQKITYRPNYGITWLRKKFGDIFSRLDTIHKCDGWTDG